MNNRFDQDFDFSTLSLKDLIEARDLYHFHLMSKANVVGTAVGLYLIRDKEEWPKERGEGTRPKHKRTYPRTFGNSQARDYSWPCIIVLVRAWVDESDFGKKGQPAPSLIVPKRLYLPDQRVVPVCTVLAPPIAQDEAPSLEAVVRPQATYGGGLALHVEIQKEHRFATAGCLMSDGHETYALTARHVCGEPGTPVSARMRGGFHPIGSSSKKQITREKFSDVYPAFSLRQTWLGLDVGLVRVDDIGQWTPNVYGLPKIKPIFDFYEQNIPLHGLIDRPVVAMGAASGLLNGTIKALFYRYKSVGGFDYVSDFLIAPPEGDAGAHHGDSGAIWFIQMPLKDGSEDTRPIIERDLRPLAVEWGAQIFSDQGKRSTYSVATSLSNVCKLLDVELVVEGNEGVSGTWGAVGHYSIGTLAIDLVKNKTLRDFLRANAHLLSLGEDELGKPPKNADLIDSGFVALADVPDIVWKNYPSPHLNRKGEDIGVVGGRDTKSAGMRSTGPEHPNHHCDADMPFDGFPTLPEACIANPDLISAANWNRYFESFPEPPDLMHRGILPFRVWQYFERLKEYAADDPDRFIAAAGTLAHYVGDSSQPLHGSIYSDGIEDEEPDAPREISVGKGKTKPAHRGEGIHTFYETQMISMAAHKGFLFDEIKKNLKQNHDLVLVADGRGAAIATLTCMRDVARILPPRRLIDVYEKVLATEERSHVQDMWDQLKTETGQVMALGARTLAMIWDAAWEAGGGERNAGARDPNALRELYEDSAFMRSVTLDEIEAEISAPQSGKRTIRSHGTARRKKRDAPSAASPPKRKRPRR